MPRAGHCQSQPIDISLTASAISTLDYTSILVERSEARRSGVASPTARPRFVRGPRWRKTLIPVRVFASFPIAIGAQYCTHKLEFVYLGEAASKDQCPIETWRLQRGWLCSRRYNMEIDYHSDVRLRPKFAEPESRGYRGTTARARHVKPRHGTAAPPLHASSVPRLAETEARRPYPILRRRTCSNILREHRDGGEQMQGAVVSGFHGMYWREAPAEEDGAWGAGCG